MSKFKKYMEMVTSDYMRADFTYLLLSPQGKLIDKNTGGEQYRNKTFNSVEEAREWLYENNQPGDVVGKATDAEIEKIKKEFKNKK